MKRPLSPKTAEMYSRILTRAFGGVEPPFNVPDTVVEWPESVRTLLRAAVRNRLAGDEEALELVLEDIPATWTPKTSVEIPSEDEAKAYEAAAAARPPGRRAVALLPLAVGLRANEALSLTRHAVDRAAKQGELLVLRKGGKEQRLPVKHATALFEELLETPRYIRPVLVSPLKPAKAGKWDRVAEILASDAPEPHQNINAYHALHRLVKALGDEAGIVGLRPHQLRHAFATRMARDGAGLPIIQWMLGHRNVSTTLRYVHMQASDAVQFLRQF